MGSSSGESDQGIQGNVWSGFSLSQSTGSLGGGRADGSFPFLNFNGGHTINEPGSYEDFTYPSPFPSTSMASAYQFSPQSPPHHSSTSTSSWFPSFFSSPPPLPPPPPNLPNSTSSEPAPLLDQTEQSLFQTFLTTLDIDPQFLFNPVLPPGMPSPPSSNMLPSNQEEYEKEGKEREVLGREVGGLDLGDQNQHRREGGGGLPGNLGQNSSRDPVLPSSPPRRRPSNSTPHADYSNLERDPTNSSKKQRVSLPPLPSTSHSTDQITYEDTLMSPTSSHSPEISGSDSDYSESTSLSRRPSTIPPPPKRSSKRSRPVSTQPSRRNSLSSQSESTTISTAPTTRKLKPDLERPLIIPTCSIPLQPSSTLTASEKRSNHIQSEQRRRNAIKLGFKDLVELVISGEKLSKIVLGSSSSLPDSEDEGGGKKKGKGLKKGVKGSGRGRGRKGDTGANAPKSVVLERSREYIEWLERGNRALLREVERVEKALLE